MIIDGNSHSGETFEADVCVVGAGAAGLTLALDLARRGLSVVIVESGGMEFQQRSHDLLNVELTGKYNQGGLFKMTRERFFGGTTNHWGGVCQPLDAYEFQQHDWVPHSGWPITRADLDPWYAAAASLIGVAQVDVVYDPQALGVADRLQLVAESETNVKAWFPRRIPSEHLHMAQWRREEVETHPRVQCLLNTTIVEIHPDKSLERVESLEARNYEQGTLHFRARDYVLCASAVENARLLLASDSAVPGGLGNTYDQVGRYFMMHVPNGFGALLPLDSSAPLTQEEFLSKSENVGWALSPQAREQYQLPGFLAFMFNNERKEPLPYEAAIRSLMGSSAAADDSAPVRRAGILVNWEQYPNPQSRVMLSDRRDALGVRLPLVNLDVTPAELAAAQKAFELVAASINSTGRARLFLADISKMPIAGGGAHQIGTTRMSKDPRNGVTDINGRVHSLDNLFIAGSSLFPTAGWQHPTFTIIALALRQSEFIRSRYPA